MTAPVPSYGRAQQLLTTLGIQRWAVRSSLGTTAVQGLNTGPVLTPVWGREVRATSGQAGKTVPVATVSELIGSQADAAVSARMDAPEMSMQVAALDVEAQASPPSDPMPVNLPVEAEARVTRTRQAERIDSQRSDPWVSLSAEGAEQGSVLLSFGLQARVVGERWILLVDEGSLQSAEARVLWEQIGLACGAAEGRSFYWPMAVGPRWQHAAGATAAVQGFLWSLGQSQRVGLLGELPESLDLERVERLPTLSELLVEPLRKRSLWQLLAPEAS